MGIKAKTWWKNNADEWLKKCQYWEKMSKGNSRSFTKEENFLIDEVLNRCLSSFKILEVGAGNGRIIGPISMIYFNSCWSVDINRKLSNYIHKKYSYVRTYVGEIIDLPFKDKEFDLVFTHEVLQHIDPSEIDKAVSELKRVGKEVWCMESWRDAQKNGEKVSDSHCGRWNYNLKDYFNTYYDFYTDWGQLFIKAKT